MATIDKATTGTNLAAGASWAGGVVPTTGDTARWLTTSQGASLTGAINVDGIIQEGASANIAHSAGTITLGAAGFTQATTNNRIWNESGTWAVGTTDQDWRLASPTAGTAAVQLQAASGLQGSAVITLRNNTGTTDASRAGINIYGANTGFTGGLLLEEAAGLFIFQNGTLTACDILAYGNLSRIMPGGGTSPSFGASDKGLVIEGTANGIGMGFAGRTLTCNSYVNFGAGSPLVTFSGDTYFNGDLMGTAGFSFAKNNTTWSNIEVNSATNGVTTTNGNIQIGDYLRTLTRAATWPLLNARSFSVTGVLQLGGVAGIGFTTPQSLPTGTTFSGTGNVLVVYNSTNTVTFPNGALVGLTGDLDPINSGWSTYVARSGLCLGAIGFYAAGRSCDVDVNDLPARISSRVSPNTNNQNITRLRYIGPGNEWNTQFDLILSEPDFPLQCRHELYANCFDSSPLILTRGVKRFGLSGTQTFVLRGTSTADNAINGPIDPNALGTLNVTKEDAGKWRLLGANAHGGTTTVNAGILSAESSSALGSSTAGDVTVNAGGTLNFAGGHNVNKGTRTVSLTSNGSAASLTATSGNNTFTCGGVTLNSNVILEASTLASLALNNSAAITGVFGLTKTGQGTLSLASTSNTYSGVINIDTGTLEVSTLNNQSENGVLGNSTSAIVVKGTLKFVGATSFSSTNRSLTLTGTAPTLDASGASAVTYSAATQSAESKTVTFTGTGTGNNTASFDLGNNGGTTGVAKSGAGKWVLSGATLNYTGTTTVSAGTLNMGTLNRTLLGGVAISGGTLENGTATIETDVTATGGTITAVLAGSGKTFSATSGTTIINPSGTTASNSFTGTSTISAGATVRLYSSAAPSTSGNGKSLGNSNVTVNGKIETAYSTTQRGQIRFGGNVTFGSGSEISIGSIT